MKEKIVILPDVVVSRYHIIYSTTLSVAFVFMAAGTINLFLFGDESLLEYLGQCDEICRNFRCVHKKDFSEILIAAILSFIAGIALVSPLAIYFYTNVITLDSNGINVEGRMYKWIEGMTWDQVSCVYKSSKIGQGIVFMGYNPADCICLNFANTNRKKALLYAAAHLPLDIFDDYCLGLLEKWGLYRDTFYISDSKTDIEEDDENTEFEVCMQDIKNDENTMFEVCMQDIKNNRNYS